MRRLPRTAHTVLLAAACCLALSAFPVVALAASTDPAPPKPATAGGRCPDGSLCTWPQRDYGGEITNISKLTAGECFNLKPAMRSAMNDSGDNAVFYSSPDCAGSVVIGVAPGRKAPVFADAASVRVRRPTPATAAPAGSASAASNPSQPGAKPGPKPPPKPGKSGTGTPSSSAGSKTSSKPGTGTASTSAGSKTPASASAPGDDAGGQRTEPVG